MEFQSLKTSTILLVLLAGLVISIYERVLPLGIAIDASILAFWFSFKAAKATLLSASINNKHCL